MPDNTTPMIGSDGGLYDVPNTNVENAIAGGWRHAEPNELQPIHFQDDEGNLKVVPTIQAKSALDRGWKPLTEQGFQHETKVQELQKGYSPLGIFGREALDQATLGVSGIIANAERTPEEQEAYERAKADSPLSNYGGKTAGFLASLLIPGGAIGKVGEAAEKIGVSAIDHIIGGAAAKALEEGGAEAATKTLIGIGGEAAETAVKQTTEHAFDQLAQKTLLQQVAGSVANNATQIALYSAPSALAQVVVGDPQKAAENIVGSIGVGAALGIGGGFLGWGGNKVGGLVSDLVGGAEGLKQKADEMDLKHLGLDYKDVNKLDLEPATKEAYDNYVTQVKNAGKDPMAFQEFQKKQFVNQILDVADKYNINNYQDIQKLLIDSGKKIGDNLDKADQIASGFEPKLTTHTEKYMEPEELSDELKQKISDAKRTVADYQEISDIEAQTKQRYHPPEEVNTAISADQEARFGKEGADPLYNAAEQHFNTLRQQFPIDVEKPDIANFKQAEQYANDHNLRIEKKGNSYIVKAGQFSTDIQGVKVSNVSKLGTALQNVEEKLNDLKMQQEWKKYIEASKQNVTSKAEKEALQKNLWEHWTTLKELENDFPQYSETELQPYEKRLREEPLAPMNLEEEAATPIKQEKPQHVLDAENLLDQYKEPKMVEKERLVSHAEEGAALPFKKQEYVDSLTKDMYQKFPGINTPLGKELLPDLNNTINTIKQYGDHPAGMTMNQSQEVKNMIQNAFGDSISKTADITDRDNLRKAMWEHYKNYQEKTLDNIFAKSEDNEALANYLDAKKEYRVGKTLEKYGNQLANKDDFGTIFPQMKQALKGVFGLHNMGLGYAAHALMGISGHAAYPAILAAKIAKNVAQMYYEKNGAGWLRKIADSPYFGNVLAKEATDQGANKLLSFSKMLQAAPPRITNDAIQQFLGKQSTGLSKDQQFQKVSDVLSQIASNPQYIDQQMGAINAAFGGNPQLAQLLVAKKYQAISYLYSQLPKVPEQKPFTKLTKFVPSAKQKEAFSQKLDIVQNPYNALMYAAQNRLTQNHIEALKTVYPKIYQDMLVATGKIAYDPKLAGLPLDLQRQLGKIMGQPLDPGMRQLAAFQASYQVNPQQAHAPMPNMGAAKGHSGSHAAPRQMTAKQSKTLTDSHQTTFGRLSN